MARLLCRSRFIPPPPPPELHFSTSDISAMNHSPSPSEAERQSLMAPPGLSRYVSAPGSFLAALADSAIHGGEETEEEYSAAAAAAVASEVALGRYFSGDSQCLTTSDSSRPAVTLSSERPPPHPAAMQRSYGVEEIHAAADLVARDGGGGIPLARHSSSPAGFFSHLLVDQGPSTTMGIGNYSQADKRLRPQWSFSRQDSLSQISDLGIPEIEENAAGNSSDEAVGHVGQSYISSDFHLGPWDNNNSVVFSAPNRRPKFSDIGNQFNLSKGGLEMSAVDDYLLNQDSVPCRARAKRGCATHPRSIAERERRTRISKRLRKLQDLVPNMDKQTSTSDMLELAIQHIRELQNKVENLKQEEESCTCRSRKA